MIDPSASPRFSSVGNAALLPMAAVSDMLGLPDPA